MTGKSKAAHHADALRIIERMDSDITPETIYWRALYERCKRFAAEAESGGTDVACSRTGVGGIREVKLSTLPSKCSSVIRGK
jgi:hypothetical protein